jgi:hypothetical protein
MMGKWGAARFCIAAFLIGVLLISNYSTRTPFLAPVRGNINVSPSSSISPALVRFTPSNISSLTITSPQNVSFTVTVTNSTPIDGFGVFLHYNEQVLRVNTIDYSNNVLGSKADIIEECVDHTSLQQGLLCTQLDEPGVISLTLSLLGGAVTPSNTTGVLFQVNFSVFGQGFASLHILRAVLANGIGGQVPLTTSDAYFTNIDCPTGSKILCKPPIASFTYSPVPSFIFRPVSFNASGSRATNSQASIVFLTWDFGGFLAQSENSTTGANGRPVPSIQHVYPGTCNCSATLAVVDSYGITAYASVIVQVISVYISLLVSSVGAIPQFKVYPGVIVVISVTVVNNSTFPENGTLVVDVEGQVVGATQSYHLAAFRQQTTISTSWNTSGYAPRVYRIDAMIPPILNENRTSNVGTAFVQLISQPVSGLLSLGLLQTGGLSILILVGVVFGLSRFLRRKPIVEEEDFGSK